MYTSFTSSRHNWYPIYTTQDANTRDVMLYHLYYCVLLLAGSFDALALIANRAYKTGVKENIVSFRKKDFFDKLPPGPRTLHELVSSLYTQNILSILFEIRNTIHREEPMADFLAEMRSDKAFLDVSFPLSDLKKAGGSKDLWEIAGKCDQPTEWGLVQHKGKILLEPYTFSSKLVFECFKLMDEIMVRTDLTGLFAQGHSLPSVPNTYDLHDDWKIISALG